MDFISTRGEAPALNFCDALLAGLARDGGLYLPREWPKMRKRDIRALRGKTYQEVAFAVLKPFVDGEIKDDALQAMIHDAYATFRHPAVAPLVQTGPNSYILELFHGTTLAFKDVAMQLLGRLMDHVLRERGQRATIVGATSGDTGGAAIDAFAGLDNIDMFILFPKGKVSPVQQRQMTTSKAGNVRAVAIEGNFDDCQDLVKAMFNHVAFRDKVQLSGVNSINWARIMAQVVYYFTAALSLGGPDRKISFTVPTGNFGDIFAGYVAREMGLPIDKLVIATNDNDILARTLKTGRYEMRGVMATTSPSMDIQISSNFERLLFEASGRNAGEIRSQMASLKQSGAFEIKPDALKTIRKLFRAGRATQQDVAKTIATTLAETGYLLDPHTACGVVVASKFEKPQSPMVTLATAHPAKFPAAVKSASGIDPALPTWLADLMDREERFDVLAGELDVVEAFISAHSRAGA
ncbi:threonine synthase [Agrobacterium vitis]|uniref:Threonine synthase n=1 Tax=Agrobacterium vitis TaxID=373 RepID=A0ABD6H7T8_AGRVI|nr:MULTISPECIES: threonine synthase [Rhizobium/Agrobacterium group]MCF1434684.1 threonine synthase [Allorhizobium ampelinum]MCF1447744.1 threonine synthase [Allorhizobium ampelinum]MCF1493837.1 threonine synthase [Allorhizobium ampelinum]MUO30452.1 threonine synthase [Agrobacterium vitis]MUO42465.1 threonine synthase [Agrobacterium vitis]